MILGIIADRVTIVGGGLISAARPLREKIAKKGVEKKYTQFSVVVFEVRAESNKNN